MTTDQLPGHRSPMANAPGRRSVWRAVVVAVSIPGLLGVLAPASVADTPSFTWSGGPCTDASVFLDVAAEDVRPFVPSRYTLRETAGRSVFFLGSGECEATTVEGHPIGSFRFSEAAVVIEDPDGDDPAGGVHLYMLWQVTDNDVLHSQWDRLGAFGAQVSPITVDAELGPALSTAAVVVPWTYSPHSVSAVVGGPRLPIENDTDGPCEYTNSTIWHDGRDGLVKAGFDVFEPPGPDATYGDQAGTATVGAVAGTPLAEMIGGESATGPAAIRRFDFVGCAGVVGP